MDAGGIPKMITAKIWSRQPKREAWTKERLIEERAIALAAFIDKSTSKNYSSALNSYLEFIRLHNKPADPTPDTLSFYIVFMCHHINPKSVRTYLSGIVYKLELYFPEIHQARSSLLVKCTL